MILMCNWMHAMITKTELQAGDLTTLSLPDVAAGPTNRPVSLHFDHCIKHTYGVHTSIYNQPSLIIPSTTGRQPYFIRADMTCLAYLQDCLT